MASISNSFSNRFQWRISAQNSSLNSAKSLNRMEAAAESQTQKLCVWSTHHQHCVTTKFKQQQNDENWSAACVRSFNTLKLCVVKAQVVLISFVLRCWRVCHTVRLALFLGESGKKNESKVNQTAIQPISNAPKSNTHRVEVVTNTSYC